ncbi:IS66 family insertion sequence element accessory protein TnpB [Escherichia coli]|nr:IS66 family insertion sequence element accessory protein TnpB [Escherichia coli]
MIPLPSGTKIWLVAGITDMRNGFNGLAAKVQTALKDDPMSGHVFIFRGRSGSQPVMAKCSLRRRSWRCCWKVSTGDSPSGC